MTIAKLNKVSAKARSRTAQQFRRYLVGVYRNKPITYEKVKPRQEKQKHPHQALFVYPSQAKMGEPWLRLSEISLPVTPLH